MRSAAASAAGAQVTPIVVADRCAIIPAVIVIGFYGEGRVTSLLILSQVVLSFQLPFAIIPLVLFTSDRDKMGEFVNSRFTTAVAWLITATILFFNAELLWLIYRGA